MNTIFSMSAFTFWITNLFVLTSCHQSGTQKVKSEPNYWYAFSINLNEDDIRGYLSDLGIKQAKMRRNQEIKIDIYIREKD